MMNNGTAELFLTTSFFRRYLLGESFESVLIRLAIILSAIVVVWSGIMLALIIHTKCQRSKQMLKASVPHHHLCDSNSSLTKRRSNRSKQNRRYDSSSSTCCCTICYFLSELMQRCIFCPSSSSSSVVNENSKIESSVIKQEKHQRESMPMNSHVNSSKVQLVVEAMTRRSFSRNKSVFKIGKKMSSYRETESSSGDELKSFYLCDNDQKSPMEMHANTSNVVHLMQPKENTQRPSVSFQNDENKNDHQATKTSPKTQKYNTRVTLSFQPITRRISNTNRNSCLLLKTTTQHQEQQKKEQRKSLLTISSARTFQSKTDCERRCSLLDDPVTTVGSVISSSRHIPLVMITDTSSSNTNIVELETFEDRAYAVSDIEKRLSRELRATYRPRHST
ncbi:unnamed protein product [Rotaria magnacalcarata]|uniref:Uncharacterized protein n=2 Tax=Rotaria magnacalcarata TaxID=392030 RepID=A0A819II63_9BILA|nr:unnamed protein product [Rotaria magnacalcarata]CAF4121672.1 unnamed protein product [Rotaria magnacalcarata]